MAEMGDEIGAHVTAANPADDIPLTDEVRQLVANAREVAQAEFAYQRARAAYAGKKATAIAIFGVVAAVFVFFALMAAVVGSVIALGPIIGLWGAMAAVTAGLLAVSAVCAIMILLHVRRMKIVLSEESVDGEPG